MVREETMEHQDMIISIAKEAIKQYKLDVIQEEKKTLFRNTKALLSHYHELKQHCEEAIQENLTNEETMDFYRQLREDFVIESIKRTRARTLLMMSHMDSCLAMLKNKMTHKSQDEKYEVLEMIYLDEETYVKPWTEKILLASEKLHVSERTVRRYEKEMVDELSVLLFGIGALKLIQ